MCEGAVRVSFAAQRSALTDLHSLRSAALFRCVQTAISVVSTSGAVLSNLTVGSSTPNSVGDAGAAETVRNGIQAALKQIHGPATRATRPALRSALSAAIGVFILLCLRVVHLYLSL